MENFKLIFKTDVTEGISVQTYWLKKSDFSKFDIVPPKCGGGYLITCSDTKLFNSLFLMDDSEEKAKSSHDSTVLMVKKNVKKAQT